MKQRKETTRRRDGGDAPSVPEEGTRQRLLHVAVEQIERHGIAQLTVRGVAAAAGANIAAVNYHFRSKDALVAEALERTIGNFLKDTSDLLARMRKNPERSLAALLGYYLEGGLRFPRLSKAHVHDAFCANDYTGRFPTAFSPLIVQLRDVLREVVPGLDEATASRRTVLALSGVFFPVFFSGLFGAVDPLATRSSRLEYVDEIVRITLAPPT